jgi:hypothetical protein
LRGMLDDECLERLAWARSRVSPHFSPQRACDATTWTCPPRGWAATDGDPSAHGSAAFASRRQLERLRPGDILCRAHMGGGLLVDSARLRLAARAPLRRLRAWDHPLPRPHLGARVPVRALHRHCVENAQGEICCRGAHMRGRWCVVVRDGG